MRSKDVVENEVREIMTEGPYYIIIEGTNMYDKTRVGQYSYTPKIFDTEEIAQTTIDELVDYRKSAELKPLKKRVPISVAEYNEKYAKLMGIKED